MRQSCWKIDNKLLLALGFAVSSLVVQTAAQNGTANGLRVGFYNETCPQAETLVQKTVHLFFNHDRTVPAALLRLFFHDCFVRGCDASITISSNITNRAENDARPNLTVRGLDLISTAKTAVENACPGTVSCADIIALATRDAVFLANGPHWDVLTGRRDGRISLEADAQNLPDPSYSAQQGIDAFAAKGLSVLDFVCLLGAHTVGVSHCGFFSTRLFDFAGTGKPDPTMNPRLVKTLKHICPNPSKSTCSNPTVFLDQGTPFQFDKSYFKKLIVGHGILRIDQQIGADNRTLGIVRAFANGSANFSSHFATSMINLGNVEVKTGLEGEIRLKCNVINS